MTEAEIMKALECCSKGLAEACAECPLRETNCLTVSVEELALDLINRKNAKIEKLNFENLQMVASIKGLRAEAIKEFAKRVKAFCDEIAKEEWNKKASPVSWSDAYEGFIEDIDQIAKEMGVEL